MNTFLIMLSLFAGAFMHGFTGFGSAMVMMAMLPLLMPMPEALFVGAFFTLPMSLFSLHRYRADFRWRDGWPLCTGAVIGTPIGLLLIAELDRIVLLRALGVVLILFPLHELFLAHRWKTRLPAWLGLPFGFSSGILGAAFNIGGPPAIVFAYSRPWNRPQAIATLQAMFLCNSGLRLLLTWPTVVDSPHVVWICLEALAPYLLIGWLGVRLAERLPPRRFKQVVMVALIGMGLKYAFS